MEERLIEFIKAHPYLYDKTDKNHKNTLLRNKKFGELSKQINVPVKKLKERWRTLRDQFFKELRNAKKGESTQKKQWKWMDHLQFLNSSNLQNPRKPMVISPDLEETNLSEVFLDITKMELPEVRANVVEVNREGKSASQLFFDCLARQTEDAHLSPQMFAQLQMELLRTFNRVVYGDI